MYPHEKGYTDRRIGRQRERESLSNLKVRMIEGEMDRERTLAKTMLSLL